MQETAGAGEYASTLAPRMIWVTTASYDTPAVRVNAPLVTHVVSDYGRTDDRHTIHFVGGGKVTVGEQWLTPAGKELVSAH